MLERRSCVLLLGLATLLVTAGCAGQPVAGEPVAVQNVVSAPPKARATSVRRSAGPLSPSRSAVATPTADSLAGLAGVWEGEYTCGQGNTGLKLTVKDPDGSTLPAVFAFFPLPSNPSAKKGSYEMVGAISGGQLKFRQSRWIDRPEGYVMVDLTVTSPLSADATQLSGDVNDPNCKGFSVRR